MVVVITLTFPIMLYTSHFFGAITTILSLLPAFLCQKVTLLCIVAH